jgi:hypothetical protein
MRMRARARTLAARGQVCWIPQGYQSDVSDALESATDTPMQDAGSGAVSGFVTKLLKQK